VSQAGVIIGVIQNIRLAVDVVEPLLLGGKARCLDGVFLVAASALALVMGQLGVGRPHDAIALVPHPEAEVHIVEGHGKLFVQPLHLVPHAGPDQQAGTRDGGEVLHGSGAEQIAAAARLLVLMAVARVAAQTRDDARMLERLVGIVEHRAADGRTAGVGALPQQLGEPVAVPHLHVVVQQQQVLALRRLPSEVVDG